MTSRSSKVWGRRLTTWRWLQAGRRQYEVCSAVPIFVFFVLLLLGLFSSNATASSINMAADDNDLDYAVSGSKAEHLTFNDESNNNNNNNFNEAVLAAYDLADDNVRHEDETRVNNQQQSELDPQHQLFDDAPSQGQVVMTATIGPSSCPTGCCCFLTIMLCSGLTTIPSSIPVATRYVDFSGCTFDNPVLTQSTFASGYDNVEDIYIQYTNLQSIDANAFDNLRRLRSLSLSHNQLTTLPALLIRPFVRIKFISLFANKWNCNKNLAWLYEVYRSNPDKFGAGCLDPDCKDVSQVRCATPNRFLSVDFVNMTFAQYQAMQQTN